MKRYYTKQLKNNGGKKTQYKPQKVSCEDVYENILRKDSIESYFGQAENYLKIEGKLKMVVY